MCWEGVGGENLVVFDNARPNNKHGEKNLWTSKNTRFSFYGCYIFYAFFSKLNLIFFLRLITSFREFKTPGAKKWFLISKQYYHTINLYRDNQRHFSVIEN